jgi:cytoskeleton protein RodZ
MTEPEGTRSEPGVGAQLRAARERTGLSTLQAAAKLHLDPRFVEALEAEEFAVLGAPVYVRGHLRRYSELVNAPADALVERYAASLEVVPPPELQPMRHAETIRPSRQLAGPLIAVIVAAAVIAGIWLALKGLPTASLPRESTPPAPASPAPVDVPAADPGAADGPGPLPLAAATDGEAQAPAASAGAATRLRVAYTAECWTEIHDARNQRLYYGLGQPDGVVSVQGTAPLRVLLGFADAATVEIDGRVMAIPAEARTGRRANFVITSGGTMATLP